MKQLTEKDEEWVVLRFLWSRVSRHLRWILLSLVFASGAAFVQVATAQLVKKLMDEAFIPKNLDRVGYLCGTLVLLFVFDGLTDFCHRFTLRIATERTLRALRGEIFERFLFRSSEHSAKSTSGKAVSHVLSDTFVIGNGLHVVADILREPLILIGLLGYLFYVNWKLTILCVVALPLLAMLGRALGRSARRNQGRIQKSLDGITEHITETMGGLRTAHAFGQAGQLRVEFHELLDGAYRWLIRLARAEESVAPSTKIFTSCVGAGLIYLGGWLVSNGTMTQGEILSFITAAGLIQQPIRQLNQVNLRLQQVVAAGRRIYDLLQDPLDPIGNAQKRLLETPPAKAAKRAPAEAPLLDFVNVSYRYPSESAATERELALREVRLELRPGRRLALVGKSGSGKTTLSLLAMRFLDPTAGEVKLAGRAARQWDLAEYRANFSYVSQDVFLFNRSLRENLAFARPGATDTEIWQALERASVRQFVEKLPRKLDTNLAEHASNLSGGERQRVAIARAFLRNAPILILDEATSQLDAHSEQAVQKALAELMENRSVLVIAHRLATIREMDEVAVFESGRIVESGKPELLLENPHGHFASLWKAQGGHVSA